MSIIRSGLLVDDEAHIRMYIRALLKSVGIEKVEEAEQGEAALRIFEESKPDFVLLDINMPGMTGIEILAEMNARNPDIPVIMLTGQASREAVEKCHDAGASFFIRKDTPRSEIMQILKDLFEQLEEDSDEA